MSKLLVMKVSTPYVKNSSLSQCFLWPTQFSYVVLTLLEFTRASQVATATLPFLHDRDVRDLLFLSPKATLKPKFEALVPETCLANSSPFPAHGGDWPKGGQWLSWGVV